jgi:hypothetical protein
MQINAATPLSNNANIVLYRMETRSAEQQSVMGINPGKGTCIMAKPTDELCINTPNQKEETWFSLLKFVPSLAPMFTTIHNTHNPPPNTIAANLAPSIEPFASMIIRTRAIRWRVIALATRML